MSSFGIFTIVLVIFYIVYYAVLISRDLYGKKNTAKSEEEEFDVASLLDEETAVSVEESEDGFSLSTSRTDAEAANPIVPETSGMTARISTTSADSAPPSGGGISAAQKKIDKVQGEMEEIDPIGNLTMSKEFFRDLLLQANKEGSLFAHKPNVPAI